MSDFFKRFKDTCAVDLDLMHDISRIVSARDNSAGTNLLQFIRNFSDRIDDYELAVEDYEDAAPHTSYQKEKDLLDIELKISLCVGILTKYFYPIIEQLDTIVDHGILSEEDYRKRKRK